MAAILKESDANLLGDLGGEQRCLREAEELRVTKLYSETTVVPKLHQVVKKDMVNVNECLGEMDKHCRLSHNHPDLQCCVAIRQAGQAYKTDVEGMPQAPNGKAWIQSDKCTATGWVSSTPGYVGRCVGMMEKVSDWRRRDWSIGTLVGSIRSTFEKIATTQKKPLATSIWTLGWGSHPLFLHDHQRKVLPQQTNGRNLRRTVD